MRQHSRMRVDWNGSGTSCPVAYTDRNDYFQEPMGAGEPVY
jgi:hypothetical protein